MDLTPREREDLYDEAGRRGLLTMYEFSGIFSQGVSRGDAIRTLLVKTRKKAFELFRQEFGAAARFRVSPTQFGGIDFYWRRAALGLVITGPLVDDPFRADPRRTRDIDKRFGVGFFQVQDSAEPKILAVPYYEVWHSPRAVVEKVRQLLLASGQYPRVRGES